MRADQLIVQRGLAPSRSAAQRLIDHGAVRWRLHAQAPWQAPRKAGDELNTACELQIVDDAELRWASRSGLKLDAALQHCQPPVQVQGALCLDVGQSTGGFTDVLLTHGARHVVGVDVGHSQLHARLRSDARVTALEGINARELKPGQLPHASYALIVADLSFISLSLVLPALRPWLSGEALLLVKPQFELQPAQIGKGGLVANSSSYALVEARLRETAATLDLTVVDYFESAIAGGDGNREFFVRLAPRAGV